MNIYVYFRSSREDQASLESQLQQLMRQLRHDRDIRCELLLKSDVRQSYLTWMEVYSDIPADRCEDFVVELDVHFRRSGLIRLVQGERHVELFELRPESDAAAIPSVP